MPSTPFSGPGAGPDPSTVPGFYEAKKLGVLPSVPVSPPVPVTLNSLHVRVFFFPVVLAYIVIGIALSDIFAWSGPMCGLVLGGGGFALLLSAILVPARFMMKEFAAGYCRRDSHVGVYVVDWRMALQNGSGPAGAEWDLRGLWRLGADGAPERAPVPGVLPVGRYPSPNRPGQLEYWTGRDWHYMFRAAPPELVRALHAPDA